MNIMRNFLSVIVIGMAAYVLFTEEFWLLPFTHLVLALVLILSGIIEFKKKKKGGAVIFFSVALFIIAVNINILTLQY